MFKPFKQFVGNLLRFVSAAVRCVSWRDEKVSRYGDYRIIWRLSIPFRCIFLYWVCFFNIALFSFNFSGMSSHILVNQTEIILSHDKFTFLGLRDFHAHVLILKIGINTSSSLLANLYNTFPEINLKSSPDIYPSVLNISDFWHRLGLTFISALFIFLTAIWGHFWPFLDWETITHYIFLKVVVARSF